MLLIKFSHTTPYIIQLGNTLLLVRSHHQTFCFKNHSMKNEENVSFVTSMSWKYIKKLSVKLQKYRTGEIHEVLRKKVFFKKV
jgi:hypothetical protein